MKGAHLVNHTTSACACYIYIRKPNKVASIRIITHICVRKHTRMLVLCKFHIIIANASTRFILLRTSACFGEC